MSILGLINLVFYDINQFYVKPPQKALYLLPRAEDEEKHSCGALGIVDPWQVGKVYKVIGLGPPRCGARILIVALF